MQYAEKSLYFYTKEYKNTHYNSGLNIWFLFGKTLISQFIENVNKKIQIWGYFGYGALLYKISEKFYRETFLWAQMHRPKSLY